MTEAKKAIWLSKIESREDALKLVKDTSTGFFFVAGLLVAISFILDSTLLIDAGVYAIGGFFIRRFNSRSAALILLVFAAVGTVFTIVNMTGAKASGGTNIILALIILGAAVRAVEATFKLHGKFAPGANAEGAPGNWCFMLNKNYLLASLVLIALIGTFVYGPIPQDTRYHMFADTKTVFGIANGCNVLSNLLFVLVGAGGFLLALRLLRQSGNDILLLEYLLFFAAIFLTGIGSSFYHLNPSNASLVWDRLPMAVAFMALLSSVVSESVNRKAGRLLLVPLLLLGVFSVLYWAWSEKAGHGDLRLYILVQFLTVLLIPLILLLYKPRRNYEVYIWLLAGFYMLSKLVELFDIEIYSFTRIVSGHTLKHVLAAAGTACLLKMLLKRQKELG